MTLEELAHRAAAEEEPLGLDCGDSSCRSPTRGHGGMRTNGGCRCSIVDVAVRHVRIALALIESPAGRREIETGRVRG